MSVFQKIQQKLFETKKSEPVKFIRWTGQIPWIITKFFTLLCVVSEFFGGITHPVHLDWPFHVFFFSLSVDALFNCLGTHSKVMIDSDTYFWGRRGEKYCNQLPRSLKSDFLVRRNMYMPRDSLLSSAADKPFLELFLRLVQKNSKCNLSLFVPADTIWTGPKGTGFQDKADFPSFQLKMGMVQRQMTHPALKRGHNFVTFIWS